MPDGSRTNLGIFQKGEAATTEWGGLMLATGAGWGGGGVVGAGCNG